MDAPDYLPLTISSLWIEWRLWGNNACGYHITNILIHFFYCIGIACIFQKLKWPGGWIAAILFAIHPVNVETVAWITQRKNILCLFFTIFSTYAFIQELHKKRHHTISLILFICALLCKAASIMLPFWLLILMSCHFKQKFQKAALHLLPFMSVVGIFAVITLYFQYANAMGHIPVRTDSIIERFLFSFQTILFYLSKAIFPNSLCFVYPISPDKGIMLLGFFVLLICIAVLYKNRQQQWSKAAILGISFYVIHLIPVLGFFDIYFMRFSYVSDHWQSLSLIGVTSIVAAFLGKLIEQSSPKNYIAYFLTLTLVIVFTIKTHNQCKNYLTEKALWEATLDCNPCSILPYDRLALIAVANNQYDIAEKYLKSSISIDASNWEGMMNLGNLYNRMEQDEKAEKMYLQALSINPKRSEIHINLGNLKLKKGQYSGAIIYYQNALQSMQNNAYIHFQLGLANIYADKTKESLHHFQTVLSLDPNHALANLHVGMILSKSQPFEAIRHIKKCIQITPLLHEAHQMLGGIYADLCRCEDAKFHYKQAGMVVQEKMPTKGDCCSFGNE